MTGNGPFPKRVGDVGEQAGALHPAVAHVLFRNDGRFLVRIAHFGDGSGSRRLLPFLTQRERRYEDSQDYRARSDGSRGHQSLLKIVEGNCTATLMGGQNR